MQESASSASVRHYRRRCGDTWREVCKLESGQSTSHWHCRLSGQGRRAFLGGGQGPGVVTSGDSDINLALGVINLLSICFIPIYFRVHFTVI